jgi:hypothetical protein
VTTGAGLQSQIAASIRVTAISRLLSVCGVCSGLRRAKRTKRPSGDCAFPCSFQGLAFDRR